MTRLKLLLVLSAAFLFVLGCGVDTGAEFDDYEGEEFFSEESAEVTEEAPAQDLEPAAGEGGSCPAVAEEILKIATAPLEGEGSEATDDEVTLVNYIVNGDEISEPAFEDVPSELQDKQEDEAVHLEIWDYFIALIPAENRGMIGEFAITTDGADNTLASVVQTESDPAVWKLNVDIADIANRANLTYTLVHEFAHLLTLGPDQVTPSLAVFNNPEDNNIYLQEVSACPNYFPGEGCADADSYVDDFYHQFWDELREEWNEINLEEDEDTRLEKQDAFYQKYQDHFLTDYAATNSEEDIAESWAFFIFSPKPAGDTIAEQKILFFYKYPELVTLRSEILSNLCANFPQ